MTPSYLSLHKQLRPDWLTRIVQEDVMLDGCESEWPIQLLKGQARSAVWFFSRTLIGLVSEGVGVAANACRLVEYYLALRTRDIVKRSCLTDGSVMSEEWRTYKKSIQDSLPLLITSAVQLAAKMNCSGSPLTAARVQTLLRGKGFVYSLEEIIQSEFDVFSSVGFKVPLWNSVQISEMLAVDVGLSNALRLVAQCMEVTEFHRPYIEEKANWIAGVQSAAGETRINTLDLCAASVCAASKIFSGPDVADRLAVMLGSSRALLVCLAQIIFLILVGNDVRDSSSDSN